MNAVLEGRHIHVVLGGRTVLRDVSVPLARGTVTAIVGPNGSGKSTLLRALCGLMALAGGEVRLDGAPLVELSRRAIARRVAFLPQDTRCDFAFTVDEAVEMGRHPHRGRFASAVARDAEAVDAAMAICDLQHLRGRTIDRLSGGERQRVAIARCLAAEPDVILLDEPTAHLDLEHAIDVLLLCQRLGRSGRSVAVATHDLSATLRFATDVLLLRRGEMAGSGTPASVLTPESCRDVFAVHAEVVQTASGHSSLVFDRP